MLINRLLYKFLMMPEGDSAAPAATAAVPETATTNAAAPDASTTTEVTTESTQTAAADKPDGSIISEVKEGDKSAFDVEAAKAKLIEKGEKAEELDKLSPEELQKKSEEADKPKEVTADDITFETPEGMEIPEEQAKAFKYLLADPKLSPAERAQALVNMHAEAVKAAAKQGTDAAYDLWAKTQADWQSTIKADKELGGQNYDQVRSAISKAVTQVGGSDAQKIFDAFAFTGAGNNPEIVRVMYRMSLAFTEGGHVAGGAPASATGKDAELLTAMYPSASKAR